MMRPPSSSGGLPQGSDPSQATQAIGTLGERAEALCKRLTDVEQALAVQEWWLLGRVLAEARLLAEVGSLLAVARGELEAVLNRYFERGVPRSDITDQFATVEDMPDRAQDAAWVAASRDQAIGLLRMVAASLPPMLQYAQMLRSYAEQLGMPSEAVDALAIVVDRLNETGEAFRQPPV